MKHYRIFISDMGKFGDVSKHEFVAEFADDELTKRYVSYMRGKRRYSEKDIIVQEYDFTDTFSEGRFVGVLFVTGEGMFQDEIDEVFGQ